jgi:hypothetical protein
VRLRKAVEEEGASVPVGGIVATLQAFLVEKWGSEEGQQAANEAVTTLLQVH